MDAGSAGCSSWGWELSSCELAVSTTPALAKGTSGTGQPGDFSQVVRAMRDRVKEDGLTGGALLIARRTVGCSSG